MTRDQGYTPRARARSRHSGARHGMAPDAPGISPGGAPGTSPAWAAGAVPAGKQARFANAHGATFKHVLFANSEEPRTLTDPAEQSTSNVVPLRPQPRIYTRDEHNISRKFISENALKVLYRLDKAGYQAYLVGGGVRDLLLGREPKDFDIATNAQPEQVRELFRNCRLIGRRFRLAHVQFGQEIIEVATFRAQHDGDEEGASLSDEGRILRDNVYGTIEEDVWRRDFTANALYYNIADFSIVDYVGGVEDLRAGRLRLIGDPDKRYREDPVRMLRAVRFATKLGFALDQATLATIPRLRGLLEDIAPARLFDEMLKLFQGGMGQQTFEALRHHGLFHCLFPLTDELLDSPEGEFALTLISAALRSTDARVAENRPITPAFLLAALLWHVVEEEAASMMANGVPSADAINLAADMVISKQIARIAMPRRFTNVTREIWALQLRLQRPSRRSDKLLEHPRFRAAYDFLVLRAEAGDPVIDAAEFWTRFLESGEETRQAMLNNLQSGEGGAGGGRGRGGRPPRGNRGGNESGNGAGRRSRGNAPGHGNGGPARGNEASIGNGLPVLDDDEEEDFEVDGNASGGSSAPEVPGAAVAPVAPGAPKRRRRRRRRKPAGERQPVGD